MSASSWSDLSLPGCAFAAPHRCRCLVRPMPGPTDARSGRGPVRPRPGPAARAAPAVRLGADEDPISGLV